MSEDLPLFFGTIALFILYLLWSAATEMGTRWPQGWRRSAQPADQPADQPETQPETQPADQPADQPESQSPQEPQNGTHKEGDGKEQQR